MTPDHRADARSQRTGLIDIEPAQALAGLLDIEPPSSETGELPPLWHWIYLLERPTQRALGHDGHPSSGIPDPPGPGRRRMFAGGQVTTHHPLQFGEQATRTSRVLRSVEKQGRSGPLTFVTVGTEIEQAGQLAITEELDIVYRPGDVQPPSGGTVARRQGSSEAAEEDNIVLEFDVDETVLFRFSALTYNAHRIHYDQRYAAEEGYPDLVVHGPLQALLMSEAARRSGFSMVGRLFSYRLVAPTFGGQRLTVFARDDRQGLEGHVHDQAGTVTARSSLTAVTGDNDRRR